MSHITPAGLRLPTAIKLLEPACQADSGQHLGAAFYRDARELVNSVAVQPAYQFADPRVQQGFHDILTHSYPRLDPNAKLALASLSARIGQHELQGMRDAQRAALGASVPDVVGELFARINFSDQMPADGFWALQNNPLDGFEPIIIPAGDRLSGQIEIAFFPTAQSLGEPWGSLLAPHWDGGIGLTLFRHKESHTYGMIFVHTAGKVQWSKLSDTGLAHHASGGSMFKPLHRHSFEAFARLVIHKGVAMTDKWWAVDQTHRSIPEKNYQIGLGGSKGLIMYGSNASQEDALRVYARVLRLQGMTLTGCDEGLNPAKAKFLASLAPKAIYGTDNSDYQGRQPTAFTADGIFQGILGLFDAKFGGVPQSVFIEGCGGIGFNLAKQLLNHKVPIAGISEVSLENLIRAREKLKFKGPLYYGSASDADKTTCDQYRIDRVQGLDNMLVEAPKTVLLSPNAVPETITFALAERLILGGVQAIYGSANNQFQHDVSGSPESLAWILQLGGVMGSADFYDNLFGALAVSSDILGITDDEIDGEVLARRQEVGEHVRFYRDHHMPPFVTRYRAARVNLNKRSQLLKNLVWRGNR